MWVLYIKQKKSQSYFHTILYIYRFSNRQKKIRIEKIRVFVFRN